MDYIPLQTSMFVAGIVCTPYAYFFAQICSATVLIILVFGDTMDTYITSRIHRQTGQAPQDCF